MRWLLWCFCLLAESYETINHWHWHWHWHFLSKHNNLHGKPLDNFRRLFREINSQTKQIERWKLVKSLCLFVPSPHTSKECWTGQSRTADTSSHFENSWHHVWHSWGAWLVCWSNNFANSHLTLVHSPAEYCAPVRCRSAHTCLIDLPAMTPC